MVGGQSVVVLMSGLQASYKHLFGYCETRMQDLMGHWHHLAESSYCYGLVGEQGFPSSLGAGFPPLDYWVLELNRADRLSLFLCQTEGQREIVALSLSHLQNKRPYR